MNEFTMVQEGELAQIDGGIVPALVALVGGGLIVFGAVKIGQEAFGGGGGEVLPGLGRFLVGTTAIATAAGGHPH